MREKIIKISLSDVFSSQIFLLISCAAIFLISILLRSIIDIGADTGVYLNLGEKIANGGRYYYDFFESNFPISFYFYSLQFHTSNLLHVSPIILSEIVINLLALTSIFWSAKILQKTTIYENKIHYNSLIIAYFLTFFLRQQALQIGEFGTKTSLVLTLLYPYISYSFERKTEFTTKDLICRGCLMGLMPTIKPHYLVLIIFVECYKFFQKKSLKFFVELDKLIMCLIGALYLFLMIKFTPEFFEFIVPMWPKNYSAYNDYKVFLDNSWRHLASRIAISSFVFLIFSRLKITENDKILALFFSGASVLLVLENIGTIDQVVTFYAIATICVAKFLADLFFSEKFLLSENKFIIANLFLLPLFDLEILQAAVFGLGGFVNIWWLMALIYPIFLIKKIKKSALQKTLIKNLFYLVPLYFLLLICAILTLKYQGGWVYIAFNLSLLFIALFFFEKKVYSKFSSRFSSLSVFVIFASISCLFYAYVASIFSVINSDNRFTSPNKFTDAIVYYSKTYAPNKEDSSVMVSIWIAHQFPLANYLQKGNQQKFHISSIQSNAGLAGSSAMFPIGDTDRVFTLSYLFDDMKTQVKNPNTKIIFINNTLGDLSNNNRCLIGTLEYYFLDPEFKKIFLKNFHFQNRILINKKITPTKKVSFITGEKPSIFDKIELTTTRPIYDFEVYVRNEKK